MKKKIMANVFFVLVRYGNGMGRGNGNQGIIDATSMVTSILSL